MRRLLLVILTVILIASCKKKENLNTQSQFYTDSLYSNALKEYRKHNIYVPANFDREKNYPIIYGTDGGTSIQNNFYRNALDSLIYNDIIHPIIYVASHSNSKIADSTSQTLGNGKKVYLQYRNFEYVSTMSNENHSEDLKSRFKNHMTYFKDELIPEIEAEFNQKIGREQRYFYGVSNGAGFGIALFRSFPERIGNYICLSTFGGFMSNNTWDDSKEYPSLYLRYGTEEPQFLKEDANFLLIKSKELNFNANIDSFQGGHDAQNWHEEFINAVNLYLKK